MKSNKINILEISEMILLVAFVAKTLNQNVDSTMEDLIYYFNSKHQPFVCIFTRPNLHVAIIETLEMTDIDRQNVYTILGYCKYHDIPCGIQ